jgi:hypothetical protein
MSRALRPLLILGFVGVLGVVVATVSSPAAQAGPPPPKTVGPLLQTTPTSGRAAASFSANYWFVTSTGAKCTYTTVEFSWDGKRVAIATVDPSNPKDPSYCSVTQVFKQPPTTTLGGHALTAVACRVVLGVKSCPSGTLGRVTYIVTPTPTTKVVPGSGPATAPLSVTYATGQTTCGYPAAQFSWDGIPVGSAVPLDPKSCTAVLALTGAPAPNAPGSHRLTAQACSTRCLPATEAGITYTVTAPKAVATTPMPSSPPSPRPSAPSSVAPSASPSTSPDPSTSPSPSSSPSWTLIPPPRPAASAPPTPSPSPTGDGVGGADAGGGPPDAGSDYVPDLATFVTGPERGGIDPAVVATNLFLTLLLVFLFALTAEIFNSTMDEHRDEVHGWWLRLMRGPLGFLGRLTVPGASLTRLAGSGRLGSIARVLLVLCLLGLVYSLLSPDFGLNSQTLVLFISLVVGLGFLTYFSEGSTSRLAARRYRANASIRLYGTAVLVSILAVVISRLVTFEPGLVYGFIASAVIVAPVAMDRRDSATLVLVPAVGLLVVCLLAWLLLGPVRVAAADGAMAPGLAETILAMIFIGGLETLFVTMIPLRFMDGSTVMRWSRAAWALTFGTVTFLWWQLLLNQDAAYVKAMEQTNVQVVLATVIVFMLTTGGLWSYFRFRPAPVEAQT